MVKAYPKILDGLACCWHFVQCMPHRLHPCTIEVCCSQHVGLLPPRHNVCDSSYGGEPLRVTR